MMGSFQTYSFDKHISDQLSKWYELISVLLLNHKLNKSGYDPSNNLNLAIYSNVINYHNWEHI